MNFLIFVSPYLSCQVTSYVLEGKIRFYHSSEDSFHVLKKKCLHQTLREAVKSCGNSLGDDPTIKPLSHRLCRVFQAYFLLILGVAW